MTKASRELYIDTSLDR